MQNSIIMEKKSSRTDNNNPQSSSREQKKKKKYTVRLPTISGGDSQQRPKAVVFVFGWAFSRKKDVLKYSDLYEDRGCATITGILDPRSVAVKNDAVITEFVRGAIEEAAILIRAHEQNNNTEKLPILVHAFCNGGGFCRLGLHEACLEEPKDENEVIVRDRLTTEVFDSAPIWISTKSSLAALRGVVKNPFLFWILAIGGTMANYAKLFWSLFTTGEAFYTTYRNRMKESDVCPHQFFVYSETDPVCDHERVDEFVAYRRAKKGKGGSVKVLKLPDTGHCRHLQSHPKEYGEIVDAALRTALVEITKKRENKGDPKRSRL